jgi:hypothetical protein
MSNGNNQQQQKQQSQRGYARVWGLIQNTGIVLFWIAAVATPFLVIGYIMGAIPGPLMFFGGIYLGLLALISTTLGLWLMGIASILLIISSIILMLSATLVGTLIFIPVFLILLGVVVYGILAPENRWFTFVLEGTAKVVVRADRFHKVLFQWLDHTIDKEWNVLSADVPVLNYERIKEVEPGTLGEVIARLYGATIHPSLTRWERLRRGNLFGSLWFYGFHPIDDIYIYKFEWWGLKPDGTPQHYPPEILDYLLLKEDLYFTEVKKAEDYDRLPLDVSLVLRIRVINPYKALFRIQNWLEALINRIRPAVRDRITAERFDVLIRQQAAIGQDIFNVLSRPGGVIEQFREEYGVLLMAIEVINIDPPKEQRETTLREFIAKQERKRIEIEAKAEAKRIQTVYGRIRDFEELGRLVRTLEALEESPGQGAKWVIPLPGGVSDLLSRALGVQPPTELTAEELKSLKDLVKEVLETKKPEAKT